MYLLLFNSLGFQQLYQPMYGLRGLAKLYCLTPPGSFLFLSLCLFLALATYVMWHEEEGNSFESTTLHPDRVWGFGKNLLSMSC